MPRRSTVRTLLLAAALVLSTAVAADAARRTVDEASAVVAYLYNFGKFIEWPAMAFTSPEAPMQYCFYGEHSLGSIAKSLKYKHIHGHPIDVTNIKRGGRLNHCHLLYIGASERLYVQPLLHLTQSMPIVTVSEIDGFAAAGGIIGLVNMGNKLKFEINTAAAIQSQLRVSAQLSKLAVDIIE